MPLAAIESTFPSSFVTVSFIATGLLLAILMLLFVISAKISLLASLVKTTSEAQMQSNVTTSERDAEVSAGTHFEEFLNEDPERHKLPKKEKFKAYRAWRTENGLNWPKSEAP